MAHFRTTLPQQVELDHARLAMLAVLLTGVVGAGAGVPASAELLDTNLGLAAVRIRA